MTDIREQILTDEFTWGYSDAFMYDAKQVKEAMDKYAIKILQFMHDNEFDFKSFAHSLKYEDAAKILEEIKTELK